MFDHLHDHCEAEIERLKKSRTAFQEYTDCQARLSAAEGKVYELEVFKDAYLKAEYEAFGVEQRERLAAVEGRLAAVQDHHDAEHEKCVRRYEEGK